MRRPAALILIASLLCVPFATPIYGGQYEDANAALERGDFPTAYRIFKEMANHGEAAGQNGLGFLYIIGQGVPQDYAEAMNWFRKAAEQGYAKAQYNIGLMYENGQGVPQDYAEATNWFRRAAEQGYAKAQINLGASYYKGEGVPQDYTLAYFWLSLAVMGTEGKNENIVGARDTAAKKLNPGQLEKVDQMVKEWKPKKERK